MVLTIPLIIVLLNLYDGGGGGNQGLIYHHRIVFTIIKAFMGWCVGLEWQRLAYRTVSSLSPRLQLKILPIQQVKFLPSEHNPKTFFPI